MVAVTEFSWEEVSAPDFGNAARQAWRAAVAEIAAKAKATLPECNSRVDKAVALVLAGDVELLADGKARVASQSNGTAQYVVCNGTCECKDFPRAPSGWCKHRIAAGLQKRAVALVQAKLDAPATDQASLELPAGEAQVWRSNTTPAPLPEAPASVNIHIELAGRQVQLTLRDRDESRLLERLAAILQRFPVAAKPVDDTPHCHKHGVPLVLQHGKDGRTWYSHKTADGWCIPSLSRGRGDVPVRERPPGLQPGSQPDASTFAHILQGWRQGAHILHRPTIANASHACPPKKVPCLSFV